MDHGKFGAYLKIPYHSSQETESKLPPQRLSCNQQNVAEMTLHGPKARLGKATEFLLASFWKFSERSQPPYEPSATLRPPYGETM